MATVTFTLWVFETIPVRVTSGRFARGTVLSAAYSVAEALDEQGKA
jgi:hypothetical protein